MNQTIFPSIKEYPRNTQFFSVAVHFKILLYIVRFISLVIQTISPFKILVTGKYYF